MLCINFYVMFWIMWVVILYMLVGLVIVNMMLVNVYDLFVNLLDYVMMKVVIVNFMKGFVKQMIQCGICVNGVVLGLFWMLLQVSGGQMMYNVEKFGEQVLMGWLG